MALTMRVKCLSAAASTICELGKKATLDRLSQVASFRMQLFPFAYYGGVSVIRSGGKSGVIVGRLDREAGGRRVDVGRCGCEMRSQSCDGYSIRRFGNSNTDDSILVVSGVVKVVVSLNRCRRVEWQLREVGKS